MLKKLGTGKKLSTEKNAIQEQKKKQKIKH